MRKFALALILTLIISSIPSMVWGAGMQDTSVLPVIDPASFAPASTDMYFSLDRSGDQGIAYNSLISTYMAHAGTSAAIAKFGKSVTSALQTFDSVVGARIGVAVMVPTSLLSSPRISISRTLAPSGTTSVPTPQPEVAIIANLKPVTASIGTNPYAGIGTLSAPTVYQGQTIYKIALAGGGDPAYTTIISGTGVLATSVATVQSVIKVALAQAPSLNSQTDFGGAMNEIPSPRVFTGYVSKGFLKRFYTASLANATSVSRKQLYTQAQLFQQAYAIGGVASAHGFYLATSPIPAIKAPSVTLNTAASIVGSTAALYSSVQDPIAVANLRSMYSAADLRQMKRQSGIDLSADVFPLFSREVAFDINSEPSTLLPALFTPSLSSSLAPAATPATVSGSLELTTEVGSQAQAEGSLNRVFKALTRGSSVRSSLFHKVVLPDANAGYEVTGLKGIGYMFRHTGSHTYLVFSTALQADVKAASSPLSADSTYQAALAHVPGTTSLTGVQYMNFSHLLGIIDSVLGYAKKKGLVTSEGATTYQQQYKPLLVPFDNTISVSREVAPNVTEVQTFVTVK